MAIIHRITFLLLAATLAVSAAQAAALEDARAVTTPAVVDTAILGADAAAEALPGADAIARLKQIYRCKARKLEETGTDCMILIVSAPPIAAVHG